MALQQERIDNQQVKPHVEHPSEFVLLSSGMVVWNGILLEHLKLPPLDISDAYAARHHLTLQLRMPRASCIEMGASANLQLLAVGKGDP